MYGLVSLDPLLPDPTPAVDIVVCVVVDDGKAPSRNFRTEVAMHSIDECLLPSPILRMVTLTNGSCSGEGAFGLNRDDTLPPPPPPEPRPPPPPPMPPRRAGALPLLPEPRPFADESNVFDVVEVAADAPPLPLPPPLPDASFTVLLLLTDFGPRFRLRFFLTPPPLGAAAATESIMVVVVEELLESLTVTVCGRRWAV